MGPAYYNEIDKYCAQWLRNLIAAGHIAPGDVDERDIQDVRPDDLRGYTQCHFFAGIGVWSYALRLAGWPDDRPVWTGSCPCQPFSTAGEGLGFDDPRHLWPTFAWLIGERRPAVIFGEQVASKAVDAWVDLVHADLEAMAYAFGAIPFPSAGVGAPHIRDRLYWMAHAEGGRSRAGFRDCEQGTIWRDFVANGGAARGMVDNDGHGLQGRAIKTIRGARGRQERDAAGCSDASLAKSASAASPTNGFWRAADWLLCRDEKWRPVEPGTFPLAHGAPARVGRLRAYGNAINAQQAAEFIRAVMA